MPRRIVVASALAAALALAAAAPARAGSETDRWSDSVKLLDQREREPKVCFDLEAKAGFQRVDAPAGTVFYKADVGWAAQWSAGPGWPMTGATGYTGQEDKKPTPGLFSDMMAASADPSKRGPKRTFVSKAPYGALLMWANDTFVLMDLYAEHGKQFAVPGGPSRSVFFGINEAKDQLGDNSGALKVCAFYRRG
ncbi:hypothetical protein AB7M35_004490 [Amorphus suaedae]